MLCVTAGGGRVLNLLVGRPRAILAVDLNPAQNALLELKIEAIRALDHDRCLRFLGVRNADDRIAMYSLLRERLTPPARAFFDRRTKSIERGILYQGKLERYFGVFSTVTKPFGLGRLLQAPDLDAQRSMMAWWDTRIWKLVAQTACRRSVLGLLSGDPGFYRHLPEDFAIHEIIYDNVQSYLKSTLLRNNHLLQITFFGRYTWEAGLPIYLHRDTFDTVKAALEETQIDIVTATVEEALLAEPDESFDAFSLSDISSYLDMDAHGRLFERVLATARPGARVCSRATLHHRPLPQSLSRRLDRVPALERELSRGDLSCVHEFVIGTIR